MVNVWTDTKKLLTVKLSAQWWELSGRQKENNANQWRSSNLQHWYERMFCQVSWRKLQGVSTSIILADVVLVIGCFHFHSYLLQKICVQRYLDSSVWLQRKRRSEHNECRSDAFKHVQALVWMELKYRVSGCTLSLLILSTYPAVHIWLLKARAGLAHAVSDIVTLYDFCGVRWPHYQV